MSNQVTTAAESIPATIYRAAILHFLADPDMQGAKAYEYFEDGAVVVTQGKITALGEARDIISAQANNTKIIEYPHHLITPGFIDTHIHFPQIEVIASHGKQLLDWLNNYTFPAEQKFNHKNYANQMANFFLDEMLRNGTTTASVFGSVHPQSVNAFFEASQTRNTRMICGKVMMDRNAPPALCDTPETSYQESKALIEKWHGNGRQLYAVTPRFAVSSSEQQLAAASRLIKEHPDTYLQTHIAENKDEVAYVKTLFPDRKDYLDVYDHHGLLGNKSTFAHGIHLNDRELKRLAESGSKIAFCPSSNLFLGSGLLDINRLENNNITFSMASDVGAGTSFSMLKTMDNAYKISQLNHTPLCPLKCFYLATLGNAKSLMLDDKIGSLKVGNEADFIVLNFQSTALMTLKQQQCQSLAEKLFALIILGDDRNISATYIAGQLKYKSH